MNWAEHLKEFIDQRQDLGHNVVRFSDYFFRDQMHVFEDTSVRLTDEELQVFLEEVQGVFECAVYSHYHDNDN